MILALAWLGLAAAQDALRLEASRYAQEGLDTPSVTFQPTVSGSLRATLGCQGRTYQWSGSISPGVPVVMPLDGLPRGSHDCQGSVSLSAADGSVGEMPLRITVEIVAPLNLDVDRSRVDLEAREMVITADRPLSKVEVEVFGEGGESIGRGGVQVPDLDEVELTWGQAGGEALKLVVTAHDSHGLAGQLILSPWSYAIPHEDVVFATGSAQVTADEAPKMESAWVDLEEVLARYGAIVEVRLYVAGFTDTVGDAVSNQALSERRARSIAAWFRQRGFSGAIFYQGFGEEVLAAGTADEVDEPLNRRALYILAAEAPPPSDALPRGDWRPL